MQRNGSSPKGSAAVTQGPATVTEAPGAIMEGSATVTQGPGAIMQAPEATPQGPATVTEGRGLREQALSLVQQQRARLGAQFAATDARATAQAQAHAIYIRHIGVARVALRGDRGAAQALDLAARKRSKSGWLVQAQQFYA